MASTPLPSNRSRTLPLSSPRYNGTGRRRFTSRSKKKPDRAGFQLLLLTAVIVALASFSILERGSILDARTAILSNSKPHYIRKQNPSQTSHHVSLQSTKASQKSKTNYQSSQSTWIQQSNALNTDHIINKPTNVQPVMVQIPPVTRNQHVNDPNVIVSASGSLFRINRNDTFSIQDLNQWHSLPIVDMHHHLGNKDAKLAFFLQLSESSLSILPRLLVVMWHPKNIYVLHFDAKIAEEKLEPIRSCLKGIKKFSNVHLLPQEPITYKGVSMLLNTLSAIEFLLQQSDQWDYFINLSGSDYPSINIATMMRILGQDHILPQKVSFVQVAPRKALWSELKESRYNFFYLDTALGMMNKEHELLHTWVNNPMGKHMGIKFIQSEAWIIAHRSFAQFSVRSSYARKLLLLLSNMQDPEEHFFAMLAWNNPQFNNTLSHWAFRGIFWKIKGVKAGQHPYYADMRRNDGSYMFGESIMGNPYFFIRKFRTPTEEVLDMIDSKVSGTHKLPDMNSVSDAFFRIRNLVACVTDFTFRDNHTEVHGANVCKGPVFSKYNDTGRPSLPR